MVTTGTKHALMCGNMTMAWCKWNHHAIANHNWSKWKTHWMDAFAEMRDINHMTLGKAAFGANAAEEEHQARQITTLLSNLANALVQKNIMINNLVVSNAQLAQALQELQAAMVRMFPTGQPHPTPYQAPASCQPPAWVPYPPEAAAPPAALPAPTQATRGPRPSYWGAVKPAWDKQGYCCHTDTKSRSSTQAQPAPSSAKATSPAPPAPTLWAEISSTRGTPSATAHHLQPQPEDEKQRTVLPLM